MQAFLAQCYGGAKKKKKKKHVLLSSCGLKKCHRGNHARNLRYVYAAQW